MSEAIKLSSDKKEKKEWSKSVTVNGVTKSLRVEELDNEGYLICLNIYGRGSEDEEYKEVYKKYYSPVNPLEKEEPVKKLDEKSELSVIMELISDKTQLL